MSKYRIGYVRVSTHEQNLDLQLDALEAYGCDQVFEEKGSGAKRDRRQLENMLSQLRPKDQVIVWRLDRLARSLKHLLEIIDVIQDRGAEFVSITEKLDTSSPGGRLIFHVFASIAEFERELMIERTRAGLAAARARGRLGGRPRKWDDKDILMMKLLMLEPNRNVKAICDRFEISRASLYRLAK
ncbi:MULTISPECIES: recombinase family protein [Kordiimonas]|jgi:DNA invertase Pin-like site-specific DNA recombinase|uniref:recombinase family protein n=1 Tax=Kordiimonas TaxID=288021 RepID=UPI00257AFCFB|nr:recombinase family protein [Kordiimonas sp. UBA4487]